MTGPGLAAQVLAAVPSGTTLFLGSSQSPRDLALAGAARDGVTVAANRGVAGIDGLVSTAVGMALAAPGPVVALLGDLSLLHDSTGLIIGPSEPRPDLTIVVGNNDGGGIFHTLESGAPAVADRFERVFGAPTGVDLERIVTGAGWRHVLATSAADLDRVLAENIGRGTVVIEVPIRRTDLRDLHARMRDAAVASLGETSPS